MSTDQGHANRGSGLASDDTQIIVVSCIYNVLFDRFRISEPFRQCFQDAADRLWVLHIFKLKFHAVYVLILINS